jgi:hypothetical protein|tara:strand:+ start:1518 stop:2846 length:1329 start_codon:yes stop_codon:yes gene_type:complete
MNLCFILSESDKKRHHRIDDNYQSNLWIPKKLNLLDWKFTFDFLEFKNFLSNNNILDSLPENDFYLTVYNCREMTNEILYMMKNENDEIVKDLIFDLQNRKTSVIFFDEDRSSINNFYIEEESEYWEILEDFLKKYNIDYDLISIVGPDKYMLKEDERFIDNKGVTFMNFQHQAAYQNFYNLKYFSNFKGIIQSSKPFLKEKKFMCLNNSSRPWRADIFIFLNLKGYIDDGYLSYGNYYPVTEQHLEFGVSERMGYEEDFYELDYKKKDIEDALNKTPRIIDYKKNWDKNLSGNIGTIINPTLYLNSYFSIITETDFDMAWKKISVNHITEKTIKTFLVFHPFILCGPYKSLEILRDWGFKTFHPFIDETYDTIKDPVERMNHIKIEIDKLCNKSLLELDEWYWKMEKILLYNHNHVKKHSKNQILNLIELMENKWKKLKQY